MCRQDQSLTLSTFSSSAPLKDVGSGGFSPIAWVPLGDSLLAVVGFLSETLPSNVINLLESDRDAVKEWHLLESKTSDTVRDAILMAGGRATMVSIFQQYMYYSRSICDLCTTLSSRFIYVLLFVWYVQPVRSNAWCIIGRRVEIHFGATSHDSPVVFLFFLLDIFNLSDTFEHLTFHIIIVLRSLHIMIHWIHCTVSRCLLFYSLLLHRLHQWHFEVDCFGSRHNSLGKRFQWMIS